MRPVESKDSSSYNILQKSKKKWKTHWFLVWKDYASNTTLHGPLHITSTEHFWRIYYIIIFIIMTCLFVAHSLFLIYQYLQYPINTDVKFQNILYSYPDVTICPNSATSMFLMNKSKEAERIYKLTKSFWESKKVNRESIDKLTKRSYLKYFHQFSNIIGRLPHHHIIWCQINDRSCLEQISITEHPTYYRCFTLRPKSTFILPGPTHGITLLLHRGDPYLPLLQVSEQYSFERQESINNDTLKNHTGFIIGFHEKGSFPNFQLTALPAAIEVKFGERLRISLDLTSLKAANLKIRPCQMTTNTPSIELIKSDPLSSSNDNSNPNILKYSYIRQSCIATKRQEIIYRKCGCFSEEYNIPYEMFNYGTVWCHDVEGKTDKIVNIDQTIDCLNDINKMTENEVLFKYLGKKSRKTFIQTFSVCPLRCDRFIHLIHSVFKDEFPHSIPMTKFINYFEYITLNQLSNPFLNLSSVVPIHDLIALDISAISEHVSEVVETRAFRFLNLLGQIGGISGLYVGITMFTMFEMLDLLLQWLNYLVPILCHWVRWKIYLVIERFTT